MIARRPDVVAALVAACLTISAPVRSQEWPREQPPGPLAPKHVDLQPYALRTLPNGLQVLVVLHHEQPSVSFRLLVRAGVVQEPEDRPGVASFVAALLNKGTTTRSAEQIATTIDSAGGVMGVVGGAELTFVNGAVIKDQTDVALGLMSDIVQHPAFSAEELELHRRQSLSGLQVAYDDPEYLASTVFDRLVFGKHPYGRPNEGTPDSIGRITRDDLVAYHRTWFVPNNALLAIVGDLTVDEAFAAAERTFASWQRREVPTVGMAAPPPPARRVVVVDRPGSAQTEIRVGHLAVSRTHPDYLALDLGVRILGGEGANRLFGVLRSDRGLTYGASATYRAFRTSGEIVAETNTRTATTGESLRLMVDEFVRLQRDAVHPGELRGAQDFIAGHFPLSIESPSAIAEQVLSHLFYGLDLKEIDQYLDKVTTVTPGDIQRIARELLKPDQLSIVLVGDANGFVPQLKAAGFPEFERISVQDLDIDSPTLRTARAGRTAGAN
ncbi:MAG: insulinase family protein [Acidobacteria bacterium]|nr:insulinase family protein [Acidobacteriota bacterium]